MLAWPCSEDANKTSEELLFAYYCRYSGKHALTTGAGFRVLVTCSMLAAYIRSCTVLHNCSRRFHTGIMDVHVLQIPT